ncbi:MAG TPA: phosphoenolpyruvate carboxylase [Solirubrobacteraceae bacterium]
MGPERATRRDFAADEELLTGVLREVIETGEGTVALELLDAAVALGRAARRGETDAADRLAALTGSLELEQLEMLVRSLTRWFQLVNLAEDNERVRRLRARDAESEAPRVGSLRDAVSRIAADGTSATQMQRLLDRSELRLVMTAHPTESRRRTTIDKLARVFGVLRELDEVLTAHPADARRRLLATTQELWGSEDLRASSLSVSDEVRGGLIHFAGTLADVVPRVYRDLEEALAEFYPAGTPTVPPLLTFGSWIGGDRDGNPYVTPTTTVQALELMREQALRLVEARVELLGGRLSLSERLTGPAHGLDPILKAGADRFPALAERLETINAGEPYRRALTFIRERVRATARRAPDGYARPAELLADLRVVERCLLDGSGSLTAGGDLHDVIRQLEVFGFHYAKLDIREHVKVHRRSLHEVYERLGVCPDYAALGAQARIELLCTTIADRRPLIPANASGFSDGTRETIETFRMLAETLGGANQETVESYIVSGTEGPADLLEVLLLMKEAGLCDAGGGSARLRIVPLFEAGATLAAAPQTMSTLLATPVYRAALRAVGDEQEIMIGYSDSNKDVGYVASGWAAYWAQVQLSEVLRRHGVTWQFFHGRGGAVGRGGGRTNDAILALPAGTVGGRLKMTEQGEVLSAKYAVPEIAHRELELAASATLGTGIAREHARRNVFEDVLEQMARDSEAVYRTIVHDDPAFVRFFENVTPVQEISRLRLGSRPARRSGAAGIDDLRAIPWVFSWTQARIVLPAWLGLGTALKNARERHGLELLREMEREWPFFTTLLSNAEMACAKADIGIAERYVQLWDDAAVRERIWQPLAAEFERTIRELVTIHGARRLLDREPVLQASIDRRNPLVDPLSFVQIELLRRLRAGGEEPDEELRRVSLLTINGIASGLRNTG